MILPRVMPKVSLERLTEHIAVNFSRGDLLQLCPPSIHSKRDSIFQYLNREKYVIIASQGKREIKIGVIDLYCHCRKDIPIILIDNQGKLTPTQWLLSGIDGIPNIDRLCEVWARNGELLPKNNKYGEELKQLLSDMNRQVGVTSDEEELRNTISMIDSHLIKYGTALDYLKLNSGIR